MRRILALIVLVVFSRMVAWAADAPASAAGKWAVHEWGTFNYLPLEVSVPSEITRVMVGRIELVTEKERVILRQIGRISAQDVTDQAAQFCKGFYAEIARNGSALQAVDAGRISLADFGVAVPESYKLYLRLGRFRNALALDEEKRRPTKGLGQMIYTYRLEGYVPKETTSAMHASRPGS